MNQPESPLPPGWQRQWVAGHPVDCFEPSRRNAAGTALIYLHGVHQQRICDHQTYIAEFEKHGWPVFCPWTKQSWWTNRIHADFDSQLTAEQFLLQKLLPWLSESYQLTPPKIGLFGTSMGGQGALRFSFKFPHLFPVVAGISPAIDYWLRMKDDYGDPLWQMYDEPEQARQDSATLHIHPLNWPRNIWFCCDPIDLRWHESADRLRSKLAALGIPQTYDLETSGGGHSFEYYNRMAPIALGFMADRLAVEQRRIV